MPRMSGHTSATIGTHYGKWTVAGEPFRKNGKWMIPCKCECGNEGSIPFGNLRLGGSTSCRSCGSQYAGFKHGLSTQSEHNVWILMRQRCGNPNNRGYVNYGGRGIVVCERWINSFENFYADMGPRPSPKHSIDRIDNDGPYSPENCRWATRDEQACNKRSNVLIVVDGVEMTMANASAVTGVPAKTIQQRIVRGWDRTRAATEPVHPSRWDKA